MLNNPPVSQVKKRGDQQAESEIQINKVRK